MTRIGYLAALAGAGGPTRGRTLKPPRRLFPLEPVSGEIAPPATLQPPAALTPPRVEPSVQRTEPAMGLPPRTLAPRPQPPRPAAVHREQHATHVKPPLTLPVSEREPEERVVVVRVPADPSREFVAPHREVPPPTSVRAPLPKPSILRAPPPTPRELPRPKKPTPPPRDRPELALRAERQAEPLLEPPRRLPRLDVPPARQRQSRPAPSATGQLRIGSIEVTVMPPPAPVPVAAQARAATRPAPAAAQRPAAQSRWFGLAQR